MLGGIKLKKRIDTNHEKNLDYLQDNYPELLDDYIDFYENGVTLSDGEITPEDMVDIVRITSNFNKDNYFKLN